MIQIHVTLAMRAHDSYSEERCRQRFIGIHLILIVNPSTVQVGRLEGLESEVDQLQHVLQSVAAELESGHQHAQVWPGLSWCLKLSLPE